MKSQIETSERGEAQPDNPRGKSVSSRKRRWRRWLLGTVLLLALLGVFHPLLLTWLAGSLIHEDEIQNAVIAFPFNGARAAELVVQLVDTNEVSFAGLYDALPNRLVERGIVPSKLQTLQDEYDRLGLPNEHRWTMQEPVAGMTTFLEKLSEPLGEFEQKSIVLVCSDYRSRWLHEKVQKMLPKDAALRVKILCLTNPDFQRENWWRSHLGRRVVITELLRLYASRLTNPSQRGAIRQPQDFQRAAYVQ